MFIWKTNNLKFSKNRTKIFNNNIEFNIFWKVIDATNISFGRLASEVAKIIIGKNKSIFSYNYILGDSVVVINTDKMLLTGKKIEQGNIVYHTKYVGGLKVKPYSKIMKVDSTKILMHAIKGMLPKNNLRKYMLRKIRLYKNYNDYANEQKSQKSHHKIITLNK